VIAQLDTVTGAFSWLCAGHHPPLLVRAGKVVKELDQAPTLPLGLGDPNPQIATESLEPGDRVMIVTDGVLEARSPDGDFFGMDRLVDFLQREEAGQWPVPETLRRLSHAILAHQDDRLDDDATVVMLEWLGSGPHRMALPVDADRG
jgi:serine phosphatase RsbU (regulator of sigma subunit)